MKRTDYKLEKPSRIHRIYIPYSILVKTSNFLRSKGKNSKEGMVFWSGILVDKNEAKILRCIIPNQECTPIGVRIPLDSSLKISLELSKRKELLFAQVHSHPGMVFHSTIDDYNPITDKPGFFSIVVPNYGFVNPSRFYSWGIYEYKGYGRWKRLSLDEAKRRFVIEYEL